jgi:hypothetical protein
MVGERHDLKDLKNLILLTKSVYPGRSISREDYLKWEYSSNPFGKAIVYFANNDNGKVAAQYVVLPWRVTKGRKSISGSLSVNTLTHPDFQGLGLFPNLARDVYEECKTNSIQFTIGFPNSNSYSGFTSRLNFQTIGKLPLFVWPVRPLSTFVHFLFNMKSNKDVQIELASIEESETVSEVNFETDSQLLDEFFSKFQERNLFSTERSAKWMKWRFEEIPFRQYKLIKEIRDGKIDSLIVIRAKIIKGVRTGIIVDFISSRHSPQMKRYLKDIGSKNKIDIFICTVPLGSIEQKLLSKARFFKLPDFLMFKKLPFIIREHSDVHEEAMFDIRNWFITFGDYDIF